MQVTVWVDGWQMQCCGRPFEVGSQVSWNLVPADTDWLSAVLGDVEAAAVIHAEEHHTDSAEAAPTAGLVRSIRAVHHRAAPRAGDRPRLLYPVPGSAETVSIDTADGWEREIEDRHFAGYLVQLQIPDQ